MLPQVGLGVRGLCLENIINPQGYEKNTLRFQYPNIYPLESLTLLYCNACVSTHTKPGVLLKMINVCITAGYVT